MTHCSAYIDRSKRPKTAARDAPDAEVLEKEATIELPTANWGKLDIMSHRLVPRVWS